MLFKIHTRNRTNSSLLTQCMTYGSSYSSNPYFSQLSRFRNLNLKIKKKVVDVVKTTTRGSKSHLWRKHWELNREH